MIEVEKKFILSEGDVARLTDGAEFLGEKIFTDNYYDTADFALTKNDMWLRSRDGKWELKIPMHLGDKNFSQQYQEIEGDGKIREIFGIVPQADFETDISHFGYASFCTLTTKRKKYRADGFIIDLDEVGCEDFSYAIGEIELMVENKDQMAPALERIEKLAKEKGLKNLPVRGKVIEFLKRKKPEHYQALVETGVVVE